MRNTILCIQSRLCMCRSEEEKTTSFLRYIATFTADYLTTNYFPSATFPPQLNSGTLRQLPLHSAQQPRQEKLVFVIQQLLFLENVLVRGGGSVQVKTERKPTKLLLPLVPKQVLVEEPI